MSLHLLDLLDENLGEVRAHLQEHDRVALQRTCRRFFQLDRGNLLPGFLAPIQQLIREEPQQNKKYYWPLLRALYEADIQPAAKLPLSLELCWYKNVARISLVWQSLILRILWEGQNAFRWEVSQIGQTMYTFSADNFPRLQSCLRDPIGTLMT